MKELPHIELPYRSGIVNPCYTILFEIIISSVILMFCLGIFQDQYYTRKLMRGHSLKLRDYTKRKNTVEILFLCLGVLFFIFIELGITGTTTDDYEDGLSIEVNQTDLFLHNNNSGFQEAYRSPSKLFANDDLSIDRGVECIFIDNNSTPENGKATISRVKIGVKQSEITGNESDSYRWAKVHERKCRGKSFTYNWTTTNVLNNCTDSDFLNMEFSIELLVRGHETATFKKVDLPSCLNITTKMPFYHANNPFYMASTRNVSSEAAFITVQDDIIIFILVQFENIDDIFDYGVEAALSFIERKDGSIHHSISQAINSVYDIKTFTDVEGNFNDYVLLRKGKYSVQIDPLVVGKKKTTTISIIAIALTSILSAFVIISVFVLLFSEPKNGRFHLSDRAVIASIVKNSFTRQGARSEEIDVFEDNDVSIAIGHKPDFDHLSVHDSHIPTGRRKGYQLEPEA